jgi:hypothetical protein
MIRNILFTDEFHFTCDVVKIQETPIFGNRDNPLGTVKINNQHRFSVNVWFGVTGDQLIGPYIFPQRLTGDIYASVLHGALSTLLQNVLPQTRRQKYYQYDGAPLHLSQAVSEL